LGDEGIGWGGTDWWFMEGMKAEKRRGGEWAGNVIGES
jgi:hypothetical protein